MLEPATAIVRFMETRDISALTDVFADGATLLESFSPYFFNGPDAVTQWANGFINHARDIQDLRHSFGEPQEFSSSGDSAFFSLPLRWTGTANGVSFDETGGLALMLVGYDNKWRIKSYGWAVTTFVRG